MEPARAVAKLVLARYRGPIMKVYARSALAKTAIRKAEKMIKTTPTVAELALYGRDTVYAIDKATSRLGYRPRYDMRRGLDLTARWLEHEGLYYYFQQGEDREKLVIVDHRSFHDMLQARRGLPRWHPSRGQGRNRRHSALESAWIAVQWAS